MAAFFEPSIAVMRTAVQEQKAAALVPVTVRTLLSLTLGSGMSQYYPVYFVSRWVCCERLVVLQSSNLDASSWSSPFTTGWTFVSILSSSSLISISCIAGVRRSLMVRSPTTLTVLCPCASQEQLSGRKWIHTMYPAIRSIDVALVRCTRISQETNSYLWPLA